MDAEERKRRQNDELAREDEEQAQVLSAALGEDEREAAKDQVTKLLQEHRIGSRLNVKFSDARGLQLTIAAALLSDLAAQDVRFTAAISGLAAALERVRILKDDELEIFDVMLNLSFGSIYRLWVDEAEIIEALPADRDADAHRRTLANMKARGILEEGAGKWRALR